MVLYLYVPSDSAWFGSSSCPVQRSMLGREKEDNFFQVINTGTNTGRWSIWYRTILYHTDLWPVRIPVSIQRFLIWPIKKNLKKISLYLEKGNNLLLSLVLIKACINHGFYTSKTWMLCYRSFLAIVLCPFSPMMFG